MITRLTCRKIKLHDGGSLINRQKMTAAAKVQVKVEQGTLSGITDKYNDGRPFYAFKGIPYAKPPIGELRFRAPVPLTRFKTEVIDCSKEGDASFHKDPYTAKLVGSEDCLYLNVYTPQLPSNGGQKMPVMVWIHGGGFQMDSGSENLYSPVFLIDKGVIVVTLNYRLGPLGFMHNPKLGIIGNAGLKDQLLALKWVNQNIEQFGGDSKNITLFGESAGGASTHLHLLSPASRPYFQKAILQSGTALMEWVMQINPEYKSNILANLIAKKELTKPKEIYDCLMKAKPIELYANMIKTLTEDERRRGLPMPFKPIVEKDTEDAFMTKSPLELLKDLKENDKPLILGYTSSEGLIMLLDAVRKLDVYDQDIARLIPRSLNVKQGTEISEKVAKNIKKFYFGDQKVNKDTASQLGHLMSDYYFVLGLYLTAELHARLNPKCPIYMYRFSYDGDLNLPKKLFGLGQYPGACHGDDMFYMFKMKHVDYDVEPESESFKVREKMCKLWTNFAKTGDPNSGDSQLDDCKWPPIQAPGATFDVDALDISQKLEVVRNPDSKRIQFWKDLFKTFNDSFLKPKL